jgi:hypothetical protein
VPLKSSNGPSIMSQDLFAAFVTAEENNDQQTSSTAHSTGPVSLFDDLKPAAPRISASLFTSTTPHVSQPIEAGEDDWGDFEAAETTVVPSNQNVPAPIEPSRHHYSLDDLGPPKSISKNQIILPAKSIFDKELGSFTPRKEQEAAVFSNDSNVLFDADEEFDDGDFGDFEGIQDDIAPVVQKTAEIDLLGLNDEFEVEPARKDLPSLTEISMQPGIAFGSTKKVKAKAVEVEADYVPKEPEEEQWDDFSAWEKDATDKKDTAKATSHLVSSSNLKPLQGTENITEDAIPPTNIPPPALLLSIFPLIFQRVEAELLKPAAAQSLSVRQQIYSDTNTVDYLKGYMSILIVFARIVSGRKLRWKRDTILAQSMRIGSASAGRVSGMKVTSIDKTEQKKEDGEAAEALAVWNAQAGRVKTAVNEARKKHAELSLVPDLREIMPVKTIKEIDGGIPSTRPCALCGLKREERVAKVDVDVMDSFGEWWIERTSMHRGMPSPNSEYLT